LKARDLLFVDAGSLNETAKSFSRRMERDTHWSQLAIILGRIDREELFNGYGYGSTRAYAEHELGIAGDEYFTLRGLWLMIFSNTDQVQLDEWSTLAKGIAQQIKRGLQKMPIRKLIEVARHAGTTAVFKREVDMLLDKEPWTTVKVRCPILIADLFDEALRRALPLVTSDKYPDPELITDKATRHRCLEVVVATFLASTPIDPKLSI
jgi:hypothetical protein